MGAHLVTNIQNLKSPVFAAGFTILGHTDSHLSNDLNIAEAEDNSTLTCSSSLFRVIKDVAFFILPPLIDPPLNITSPSSVTILY